MNHALWLLFIQCSVTPPDFTAIAGKNGSPVHVYAEPSKKCTRNHVGGSQTSILESYERVSKQAKTRAKLYVVEQACDPVGNCALAAVQVYPGSQPGTIRRTP